eukprot:COSAG03_NODE_28164_length_221_cov_37.188525_1_plen_69_part_01
MTSNYSRPCGLVLHQSVDVIWNEETGSLAGQREESATRWARQFWQPSSACLCSSLESDVCAKHSACCDG